MLATPFIIADNDEDFMKMLDDYIKASEEYELIITSLIIEPSSISIEERVGR